MTIVEGVTTNYYHGFDWSLIFPHFLTWNVDARDMGSHGSPDPHYVRFCETWDISSFDIAICI